MGSDLALAEAGVGGVMVAADTMSLPAVVEHVRRLESLGYPAAWITDMFGREIYVTAGHLLAHTDHITIATGIAHIYGRDAIASVQAARTLSELSGGRFVQGLGVSHPIASEMRGVPWENPVDKTRAYLSAMRGDLPIQPRDGVPPVPILLAAHGPKMLAVAAELADGANIYQQPPERMPGARAILGPDKVLSVVLPCCLTTDPSVGRAAGRRALAMYLPLPAYQRQWARSGFTEADWSNGGSDRLVDAHIAWGDADQIRARLGEYLAAGATQVVIGAMPAGDGGASAWDLLEALAVA